MCVRPDTRRQVIFAQLAAKWAREPAQPPPLNLLGLPFAAFRLVSRRLFANPFRYTKAAQADMQPAEHSGWRARFGPAAPADAASLEPTLRVAGPGRSWSQADSTTARESQSALARHIDVYVAQHLSDQVPEERWRSLLQRTVNRMLREQQAITAHVFKQQKRYDA